MKLYIVRHGFATKRAGAQEPSLTEDGAEAIRRLAAFLKASVGEPPDEIRHSTKLRARETAEILAQGLGVGAVGEHRGLKPGDPVEEVAADLVHAPEDLMLVSHLPFVDRLTSLLLSGAPGEFVDFSPGSVACLARNGNAGTIPPSWHLLFFLRPGLIA